MKEINISDLTLREKIGQTVCVRENLMVKIPNLTEHLKKYPYGCMWAMGNEINDAVNESHKTDKSGKATAKSYRENAKKIMSATKVPMLMAGNTENNISSLFPELTRCMSQMALAATEDCDLVFKQSAAIAREMRASGIQWKWSPNVDIDDLHSFVSYGRGFSDDPDKIIRYASAVIKGTQSEGVAVSVKHFPGKDNVEYRDSHFAQTFNLQTREEWDKTNGYIYRELFKACDPWAVMISHQSLPCVDNKRFPDGTYVPSTLSYKVITELLKGELGYRGVVITDAIGMAALHTLMSENELYINLILAGNDMILGPTQMATDDYIDVIEKAVLDGRIPESRIDDACSRVLEMKKNIGMFKDDYGLDIELTPELTGQTVKIEEMAAKKAVTLIKNQGMLPLSSDKVKKVLIAPMAYSEDFDESIRYTGELLSARGIEVDYILPGDAWLKYDMTNIKEYDLVLAATYMAPHRPFGANTLQGKHIETLHLLQLSANSKTIGIAYGSPHLYFDWFTSTGKAFVAAYNYTNQLQEAVVSALFGEIQFEGKCPFELIPDYIRNNPFA